MPPNTQPTTLPDDPLKDPTAVNPQAQKTTSTSTAIDHANPLAKAATYEAAQVRMGDEDTVESRISNIIKHDSPLMQQAKTKADRASNSRGLLSSSMAVGAAQDSVIKAAQPIASQDATTSKEMKLTNQAAANQAAQFGADQTNAANVQVYQGKTQKDLQNRKAEIDKELLTADGEVRSKLLQEQGEIDKAMQSAQQKHETDRQFSDAVYRANLQNDAQGHEKTIELSRQQHELNLQKMTNDQVLAREKVAGDFDVLIENDRQAANAMLTYDTAVANILNNPEMKTEDKNAAIIRLGQNLETTLTIIGQASGKGYAELLDFG